MAKEKKKIGNKYFYITDNSFSIQYGGPGGWGREADTREEAFKTAHNVLGMRMASGLPTKAPYIIYVTERAHSDREWRGREWDIVVEIKKKDVPKMRLRTAAQVQKEADVKWAKYEKDFKKGKAVPDWVEDILKSK